MFHLPFPIVLPLCQLCINICEFNDPTEHDVTVQTYVIAGNLLTTAIWYQNMVAPTSDHWAKVSCAVVNSGSFRASIETGMSYESTITIINTIISGGIVDILMLLFSSSAVEIEPATTFPFIHTFLFTYLPTMTCQQS